MSHKQLPSAERKRALVAAAVRVAMQPAGLSLLTRAAIAREAGCSDGLVSLHLGDMQAVRKAVLKRAEKEEILSILLQVFDTLKPELRRRIAAKVV